MIFTKASNIAFSMLKQKFRKFGMSETKIISNWGQIVGEKLSDQSTPTRIYTKKTNNNVLNIISYNSAASFELNINKNHIIKNINLLLANKQIHDIRIIVDSSFEPQYKSEKKFYKKPKNPKIQNDISFYTDDVEDLDLRTKLNNIANKISNS